MGLIEIIQSKEHNLTIFWVYERITKRQNRLLGINFHWGVDFIDSSFAVVDEELTKIYTNRFKCNLLEDKIDIALESIYEEIRNKETSTLEEMFERNFLDFLIKQSKKTLGLNVQNKQERDIIRDVVNIVLNEIDME